jgi:hypothetical protein
MDNLSGMHVKINISNVILLENFNFFLFKNSSWESLFIKSTNNLSTIELDCCYCFVDLCREALFIVYQYTIDEKIHKQKLINQRLTVMVDS